MFAEKQTNVMFMSWYLKESKTHFFIPISIAIGNFKNLYLAKVLFLLKPPKYTILLLWRIINFPKDNLRLLYF